VAIGVPIKIVLDFDCLAKPSTLKGICEAIGKDYNEISKKAELVRSSIESKRPLLKKSKAKEQIDLAFSNESTAYFSAETAKKIGSILKSKTAWGEAKKVGSSYVPSGDPAKAYHSVANILRSWGIFLVEVGEVEGFCRTTGNHGPTWVGDVLSKDLISDPELNEARSFARGLIENW
jgi:hypothetical protein